MAKYTLVELGRKGLAQSEFPLKRDVRWHLYETRGVKPHAVRFIKQQGFTGIEFINLVYRWNPNDQTFLYAAVIKNATNQQINLAYEEIERRLREEDARNAIRRKQTEERAKVDALKRDRNAKILVQKKTAERKQSQEREKMLEEQFPTRLDEYKRAKRRVLGPASFRNSPIRAAVERLILTVPLLGWVLRDEDGSAEEIVQRFERDYPEHKI